MGRLSVPRGHECLPLPLLHHVVSANASHTAPPPIRPIVILHLGAHPVLHLPVRAGQRASWKRPLAFDLNINTYSIACPQYPNVYRIGTLFVSVACPIRHLTASGSYSSFIQPKSWSVTVRLFATMYDGRKQPRSDLLTPGIKPRSVFSVLVCHRCPNLLVGMMNSSGFAIAFSARANGRPRMPSPSTHLMHPNEMPINSIQTGPSSLLLSLSHRTTCLPRCTLDVS
jgi:hypothetical protein